MNQLMQDLRYALRQLRKSPGFTLTAVITLALGIGANTAIFTLVHAILLRSLPVVDPSKLYRIGDTDDCCVNGGFQNPDGDFDIFSFDMYRQLRAAGPEFEELAAVQAGQNRYYVRRGETEPRELRTEYVTGNYFATFGLGAFAGRTLMDADDVPGAAPAVVISYASWQSDFAGDPSIVGSTVFIQTHPATVVGIAPRGFFGDRVSGDPPAVWIPLADEPMIEGANTILNRPDTLWLYPIGRLRPGASVAAVDAKLSSVLRQYVAGRPVYLEYNTVADIAKQHVVLSPVGGGIQNMQQETGRSLKMLMILATVVLLIACVNIANLLVVRGSARNANTALRMAMGATRGRLVRQMLTESVVLSCIGGMVSLAVAYAGARAILAMKFPESHSLPIDAGPTLPVLGFAFAVSMVTGILFGLAPALLSWRTQPAEALRGVNRSTRDRSSIPQRVLVVFQAALSLVLLVAALPMTRSIGKLEHQNFGIQTADRYVFHFDPAGAGYTTERLPDLNRQMNERLSTIPGVANAGIVMYAPLEGNNWSEGIFVQGRPAPTENSESGASWDRVNPGFLDSLGVPVQRGRNFSEQDTATSQPVAMVNESFVKRFFPHEDPIGKHFGVDAMEFSGAFEIVGVFADFKMNDPRHPAHRLFLRPWTQQFKRYKNPSDITGETRSMFMGTAILHFNGPAQNVEQTVRRTMASIDPNLTVTDFHSYGEQVSGNFSEDRMTARLTGLFGLLALILASVGLYGVMSYLVVRRTSEIGIRMALGATRSSAVAMVLRGVGLQVGLGLALGIPASLLAGHLMASELYGVVSYDPLALAGATLALAVCAAVAGFVPARRAASIEPMQALRSE
jgi:predicted permease